MNTRDTLYEQLPELKADLANLSRQRQELDVEISALESVISGIEGLRGPAREPGDSLPGLDDPAEPTERLRGIAAVRHVVHEKGGVLSAKEVHAVLEERGWLSEAAQHPLRGTEAAINRLYKAGELEKVERGRYRARPQ